MVCVYCRTPLAHEAMWCRCGLAACVTREPGALDATFLKAAFEIMRFSMPGAPWIFGRRRWKACLARYERWIAHWEAGTMRVFVRPYVELGRAVHGSGLSRGRRRGRFRGNAVDAFTSSGRHESGYVFFEHYEDEATWAHSLDTVVANVQRAVADGR